MARNFLIDAARYFAYSSALAAETRPCQTRAMAGPDAPASEWWIAKSAARLRAAMAMRMTASYSSVIGMAKRPSSSPAPVQILALAGFGSRAGPARRGGGKAKSRVREAAGYGARNLLLRVWL